VAEAAFRPRVSIITPSFRRAAFIETCLASVRAQDYANLEHIVVDGGSNDGTVDVLRRYADTYDLRWVSAPDRGMYHAIEKGLSLAHGEVLAYLNTDDAYLPWSVSTAVEALAQGASVVFGDLVVVRQVGGRDVSYVQFYRPFDFSHYLWSATLAQPTVFWTRQAREATGAFDTSYRLVADCEYWLRLAAGGFVPRKVEEVLAVQVDHPQTLRESRAAELAGELGRLRAQYGSRAAPHRHPLARRLARSVRWRRDTMRLAAAALSRSRTRWTRFTRFLHEREIPFHPSYAIAGLLPAPLRFGAGASFLDGRRLLDAIRTDRRTAAEAR
jgi:cellulose synthase/poly-beta-1,6-N-acetylglucosamine synthase-like glycosyltransferase